MCIRDRVGARDREGHDQGLGRDLGEQRVAYPGQSPVYARLQCAYRASRCAYVLTRAERMRAYPAARCTGYAYIATLYIATLMPAYLVRYLCW
eukprot:1004712-Rhodomonas_salina.1